MTNVTIDIENLHDGELTQLAAIFYNQGDMRTTALINKRIAFLNQWIDEWDSQTD
jgi:hypothetical protein